MDAHILIIDDQLAEIQPVAWSLREHGYRVTLSDTAADAITRMQTSDIDLAIVDVNMAPLELIRQRKAELEQRGEPPNVPEENQGYAVAHWIRQNASHIGILFLTNQEGFEAEKSGLESGADDYVVKFPKLELLLARIKAILYRTGQIPKDVADFGGYRLDLRSKQIRLPDDIFVKLTNAEFSVLLALVQNPEKVVTRQLLYRVVNETEMKDESDRSIDTLVSKLRKKMSIVGETKSPIKTIQQQGYMLAVPVRMISAKEILA